MTDAKGRRASAGWIFFDADCPFCVKTARRLARIAVPRGFALAPLQDPRVPELLNLRGPALFAEMRLLAPDGRQFGGADALIELARTIWFAWPIFALAQLPGVKLLLRAAYRRFAARRSCAAGSCPIERPS